VGGDVVGEAQREAPAQAELRPTCAGPSSVNLPLILALMGQTLRGTSYHGSSGRIRPRHFRVG
jgi:hypothetical protein